MTIVANKPDPATQIGGLIFAVILLDGELRIAESNHAAENLLGQSSPRLFGQPLAEVVDLLDQRVIARLEDPEAGIVARDIVMRVGGQERRVNLTVSPVTAHPGWRVLTLSDAGRGDDGQEKERDVAIGAPSILAHEIKNPLSAIRGAGQLVERKL